MVNNYKESIEWHQIFFWEIVGSVKLAEALTLNCWTKELLFKTWLFELQHFTSTIIASIYTHDTYSPNALAHTSLLDAYTLLHITSLHTCHKSPTHLTNLTLVSLISHTTPSHTTTSIYTRCLLVRKPTWSI